MNQPEITNKEYQIIEQFLYYLLKTKINNISFYKKNSEHYHLTFTTYQLDREITGECNIYYFYNRITFNIKTVQEEFDKRKKIREQNNIFHIINNDVINEETIQIKYQKDDITILEYTTNKKDLLTNDNEDKTLNNYIKKRIQSL